MSKLISGISIVVFSFAFSNPIYAATNCDTYEKSLFSNVIRGLWSPIDDKKNTSVIYVLGAPWCSACRLKYQRYVEQNPDLTIRIIPVMAEDKRNWKLAVDMALSSEGLKRTYSNSDEPKQTTTAEQFTFIRDAILIADKGYRERVVKSTRLKEYVSPTILFTTQDDRNRFVAVQGVPRDFQSWSEGIVDAEYATSQPFFKAMINNPPRLQPVPEKNVYAGSAGALLYALPHQEAPTGACFMPGEGLKAVAETEHNGDEYWVVEALNFPDGTVVNGYMRKAEIK